MWDASDARSGRAADVIDYCIHRYCDETLALIASSILDGFVYQRLGNA
jgi:hypothetical protein